MSKRPEPVMACTECGPVIREPVENCPLCPDDPAHIVYWVDLAAGLEHLAAFGQHGKLGRLLRDAAHRLRALEAQFEALVDYTDAQNGAKERRQGLKAARLATVIRSCYEDPATAVKGLAHWQWVQFTREANRRYNANHSPPSPETKALVAAKFAEPQEAPRG